MVEEEKKKGEEEVRDRVRGPGPKTSAGITITTTFQVEFLHFQHVGGTDWVHLHRVDVSPPPTGSRFLTTTPSRGDAFGEDTRLYNYGVPVIGRSKLRFPAPRVQEYAARARRAALREI